MKKVLGLLLWGAFQLSLCGCMNHQQVNLQETIMESSNETTEEPVVITAAVDKYFDYSEVVRAFEEKNPGYKVELLQVKDSDYNGLNQEVREMMRNGEGPDIIGSNFISFMECLENDYIKPWNLQLQEEDVFMPGLFESGKIQDLDYGIPFSWSRHILVVDKQNIEAQNKWDFNEMKECIEKTECEMLAYRLDGFGLLELLSFVNPYMDSHIALGQEGYCSNPQEFYDILSFCKTYGYFGSGYMFQNEVYDSIVSGKAFGAILLYSLSDMNMYEILMNEGAYYVGYPSEEGSVSYGECEYLFLNKNTEKEDAAKEFVKYLLSADAQMVYANYYLEDDMKYPSLTGGFVRKDTLEYLIEKEMEIFDRKPIAYVEMGDIFYRSSGISENSAGQYRELIDDIHFIPMFYSSGLGYELRQVLRPYFEGEKTEEAILVEIEEKISDFNKRIENALQSDNNS